MLPGQKQNYTTVAQMMEKNRDSIAAALPKHLTVERLSRVALGELRTNPKLLECSPASLMNAIVKASQLGLEVGSAMGHAYLVPFKTECTLIIGYRGLIALARRSGEIQSITARVVYARDTFELEYGLEEKLRHIPSTDEDPGAVTHVYAVAKLKDGGIQYEVMTRAEVDAIRNRSNGYQTAVKYGNKKNPWMTDYEEMARKTVMRRLFKYLPMSIEMADAMNAEADDERAQEEKNITPVADLNAKLAATSKRLESAPADDALTAELESEAAPEWPKPNADGELEDVRGVIWDGRIHSSAKACNDSGIWRRKRGVDPALVEKLEREDLEEAVKAQNAEPDEAPATDDPQTDPDALTFEQIREGMSVSKDEDVLNAWVDESRQIVITQSQRATLDLVYDQRRRQLTATVEAA
jgi:recombination protein RecT